MFCPKCGAQNPDSAAFCAGCGAALGTAPASPTAAPAVVGGGAAVAAARKNPLIIAVAAIVVAIAVIVFAFMSCTGSSDQLKQGTYTLTANSGDEEQTTSFTVTTGNVVTTNESLDVGSYEATTTFVPDGTDDGNVIYRFTNTSVTMNANGVNGTFTLGDDGNLSVGGEAVSVDGETETHADELLGQLTVQKAIAPRGGTEGHVVGKWGFAFQGYSNMVCLLDIKDGGTATAYVLGQQMPNPDQIFEVDQLLAAGAASTELAWEESSPGTYALWPTDVPDKRITITLP